MVAAPRLVDVLALECAAEQILEPFDGLQHGDAVAAAAAQVVDGTGNGSLAERHDRRTDVVRVNVVANLLALVAEDAIGAPFADRARDVREEAVQLGPRVMRSGETAAA